MPSPVAALFLAAVVQGSAVGGELPPQEQAAALAFSSFAIGCLSRFGTFDGAAAFAHSSDELGSQLARDHPAQSGAFRLDGGDGRGCRVRYTGPRAADVWRGFEPIVAAPSTTPDGGGCRPVERTDVRVRAVCVDTGPSPPRRGDLLVKRSGSGAGATVTATLGFIDR